MATRLAFINQKGGVGKTMLACNVAGALARNQRVCLVDLDPQGGATEGLGMAESSAPTSLADALLGEWDGNAQGLLMERAPGFAVVPTSDEMFLVETRLVAKRSRETRLDRILDDMDDQFDVIVLDCPPSLGILTDNALVATTGGVVIPMQPDGASMRALGILLDQVSGIRQEVGAAVPLLGLVLNFVDDTKVAQATIQELTQIPLPILAQIRHRTKLREAWNAGRTITEYAPSTDVAEWITSLATRLTATVVAA